jgi:hypothetical protein
MVLGVVDGMASPLENHAASITAYSTRGRAGFSSPLKERGIQARSS